MDLVVCQHNVLSAQWLTKDHDLLPCVADFRDSEARHRRTAAYLADIRADVYCLCEVDSESYAIFQSSFADYYGCFCPNRENFWEEWRDSNSKYLPNGPAIFLRSSLFSQVQAERLQIKDGSAACFMSAVLGDIRCLFVAIHLDNTEKQREMAGIVSKEERQVAETREILAHIAKLPQDLVIVSGDYNTSDVSAFIDKGFIEYAKPVGAETTPLLQGAIDHSLVWTSNLDVQGIGKVLHNPSSSPVTLASTVVEICRNVRENGSDHYATITSLTVYR